MDKRLSRTDLGFSLMFLLMLVIAIGAFFYGVKVGTDRTRADLAPALASSANKPEPTALNAYQQQDLVSFYHTVFLSYREFENSWFAAEAKWRADPTVDLVASLKELEKTANHHYDKVKIAFVSPSSPLLIEAQDSLLKSLKLFSESFSAVTASAGASSSGDVIRQLKENEFFQEGLNYALAGQNAYYTSMLKWGATLNPDIPGDYTTPSTLNISEWQALPLLVKNKAAADYISESLSYNDFLPHDLTASIDQFIVTGQAERMKQSTIGSIAELLLGTNAVRSGDFLNSRASMYAEELLPQLPFFITE